jgi:hypothetical protein
MKKSDFAKIVTFDNTGYTEGDFYTLCQIFMAEKGNYFGFTLASVEDYLRGLPSCLNYPFYDGDILEKTGLQPDNYWRKLAAYVYDLINQSKADLVGVISNIERVDTSYYGNPRHSFILDTGVELVRLQTEPNASLGYSITNYDNKKAIVSTRFYRGKLCATRCEAV